MGSAASARGLKAATPASGFVAAGLEREPGFCRSTCRIPRCGDGILDGSEVCDDGNVVAADGCSATCLRLD